MSHAGITLQMKKFYTEHVLGGCQSTDSAW